VIIKATGDQIGGIIVYPTQQQHLFEPFWDKYGKFLADYSEETGMPVFQMNQNGSLIRLHIFWYDFPDGKRRVVVAHHGCPDSLEELMGFVKRGEEKEEMEFDEGKDQEAIAAVWRKLQR